MNELVLLLSSYNDLFHVVLRRLSQSYQELVEDIVSDEVDIFLSLVELRNVEVLDSKDSASNL